MSPRRFHAFMGFVILALFVVLQVLCPFNEVWDDAFISLRYARNIARGLGAVFGPGSMPPVEGYSNPLWTFLLAWYFLLPGSVFVWIKITNLAAIAGLVAGARSLVQSLTEEPQRAPVRVLSYLPGLLIALDYSFFIYFNSGMETVVYAAAIVVSLAHSAVVLRRPDAVGLYPNAILWTIVALLRPEGILLSAPMAAMLALRGLLRSRWFDLGRWLLPLGGCMAAFLIWRVSYYGDLLPNTYYAKVPVLRAAGLGQGWSYYLAGLAEGLSPAILLLAILGLVLISRGRLLLFGLVLLTILVNALYVVLVAGDFFPLYRFLQPTFALAYILATVPIIFLTRDTSWPWVRFSAQFALLLLTIRLQPVPRKVREQANDRKGYSWNRLLKEALSSNLATPQSAVGAWLRESLPAGSVIATGQCGQIPYYAELETVDVGGLNDRHLARNRLTYDYVKRRGVGFIVLGVVPAADGPSVLYADLVTRADFQADFKLTHRLSGQNQHGAIMKYVLFSRRDLLIPSVETDIPEPAVRLRELLNHPSAIEVAF